MRAAWRENVRIFLFRTLVSPLAGVTPGDWWRLLKENDFAVDPAYWPRAALLTVFSLFNAYFRWREDEEYHEAVAETAVPPPIFVLGHWRSGTTHLHNLLAADRRFAYLNNYQAAYPHSFLDTEASHAWLLAFALPSRRLQDNVDLSVTSPQEDEFALSLMTFLSPCTGWVFPRRQQHYDRYLTFRDVPEEEVRRWKDAFRLLLKKLTWKLRRPLLLKSPPHTARIRLLLEMFPGARFVHIHRDPYVVFQSTRHLIATSHPFFRLQTPERNDDDEQIIRRYREMYEAFFEQRNLVPAGQYAEIGFEDLDMDPMGQIQHIYDRLNLGDFADVAPAVQRYLASVQDYRKNRHEELPAGLRERIAKAWQRCFDEWGYPTRLPVGRRVTAANSVAIAG